MSGRAAEPVPGAVGEDQPLTRRRHRALHAARHALHVPPVPRHFRADIEGMRALAVLGVVLWHAGVTAVPGGFAGVDVFFVLSGFLVSSLLLEEARERGRIDLGRFYARRARRLLPAALTALAGTAALVLVFMPRGRWQEVGGDLLASALYLVNWRMAGRSVDYLDLERAPSPLQHYWSLSVEEQFYVVWPVLLLLMLVVAAGRARVFGTLAWSATSLLFVGSLAISWWWTQMDPSAYFVTPTRIFELMLGALVALGARGWPRIPRVLAALLGWCGLAMVLAALVVIDMDTPFPGTWALLPTTGTALVLVAGPAAGHWGPEAVLRARSAQFMGRISYSLYLWHWPFVAVAADLAQVGRGGPDTLPVHWGLLAVLVSVVPAWLSFRYVEDPVRRHGRRLTQQLGEQRATWHTLRLGLNCTLAGALLGVLLMVAAPPTATHEAPQWRTPVAVDELRAPVGAGTLDEAGQSAGASGSSAGGRSREDVATTSATAGSAALGASGSARLGEPLPRSEIAQDLDDLVIPLAQVPDDRPVMEPEGCFVGLSETEVGICGAGDPDGRVTVALIGDSHAGMWVTALDEIGRDRGWRILALTKSSCPPGVGLEVSRVGQAGSYQQCETWQNGLTEALEEIAPDVVLMSSASYAATGGEDVSEGLARRADQIEEQGAVAALIRDVPRAPFDVPACLTENPDDVPACAFDRAEGLDRSGTGHGELRTLRPALPVLDLTDDICPGRTCSPVVGGLVVWRDSNHLSASYIRSLRETVEDRVLPIASHAQIGDPATAGLVLGEDVGD